MDKFRLAVFNTQPPHLYRGGVERRINETMRRLTGYADVTVYSGTKAGFKVPIVIEGVRFAPLASTDRVYPLDNWTFNRSVSKTVFNDDVYEAHNDNGYGLLRAFRASSVRGVFVHTIHGVLADEFEQVKLLDSLSFRDRIATRFMARLARLEGETAKKADLLVTISRYSFEKLQKHYDVDSSKVCIVPNGVDVNKYKPIEEEQAILFKRQFGLEDDVPLVLFVGSLIPRKGVMFLVEAAKQIVKTYSKLQFVIVGEGPLKTLLINRLIAANLLDNFIFKNGLSEDELSLLYGCCDVFVLPSIQEGQGIVSLEASASGKPVVAFNIGGVNEAVVDGETGLLVDYTCSDALAEALLRLLGDAVLRQRLGLAGRRFVCENFTWDICAKKMLAVYQKVLDFNV
ncbi:MAG: glycosyltransferase family 4 protein [Nitrososphaerota archaeon]|jgi:glycosyltransferase involved in cell wall biosynthesis|nr:glycosyltransferase family 4 protein [Nitrososphaerota archaeon]